MLKFYFVVIAWAVIPLEFRYEDESFRFASWNLFVAICALPSLILGVWLFAFPESPKFLLECGESEIALDILKDIYVMNTGEPRSSYPVSITKQTCALLISANVSKLSATHVARMINTFAE